MENGVPIGNCAKFVRGERRFPFSGNAEHGDIAQWKTQDRTVGLIKKK
jgi:hypothetical protein